MAADPRRWCNLRGLAREIDVAPAAPRPLPPWWGYDELLAAPPTLAPVELTGAPDNDCNEEAPDAG